MSDSRHRPEPDAAPPRPPSRPPSPASPRALSAERAAPLAAPAAAPRALSARLQALASDTALNLLASAREALEDFRSRDRFFKYKAGIVAAWTALTLASFAVACPGAGISTAALGARLVVNAERVPVILLVQNDSDEAWREVTVVVNRQWRASAEGVAARGALTLTPRLLMGRDGALAPLDLRVQDVQLRTSEGSVELMASGRLR